MTLIKHMLTFLGRRNIPHISPLTKLLLHPHLENRQYLSSQVASAGPTVSNILTSKHRIEMCHRGVSTVSTSEGGDEEEVNKAIDDDTQDIIDIDNWFKTKTQPSENEWENLYTQLSEADAGFTEVSRDAVVMKRCLRWRNYSLATAYVRFLEGRGRELNLATLALYLRLCGVAGADENTTLELYHQVLSRSKLLDSKLSESLVLGVAGTSEWRRALDHLPAIRRLTPVPPAVYSAIVTAAFRHGEHGVGWHYLETMCFEGKVPDDTVLLTWVRECEKEQDGERRTVMVQQLLTKLAQHEIFPSPCVAEAMARLHQQHTGGTSLYVRIRQDGRCPACHHQLKMSEIEQEEFDNLKAEFVSRVLLGSDIYRSTRPEEWESFNAFLQRHGPFAAVLDGLNTAYLAGKTSFRHKMALLRSVVEKVKERAGSGKVLVIGRRHMQHWSPQDLRAITRLAHVYTLENMSKDDGFFIHATLQSGLGAQFVSSDLLRDHLYRLGDARLQDTFRRWQRRSQVCVALQAATARIVSPSSFSTTAQHQPGAWHVPYDTGAPRHTYELPDTWLCLTTQPGNQGTTRDQATNQLNTDANHVDNQENNKHVERKFISSQENLKGNGRESGKCVSTVPFTAEDVTDTQRLRELEFERREKLGKERNFGKREYKGYGREEKKYGGRKYGREERGSEENENGRDDCAVDEKIYGREEREYARGEGRYHNDKRFNRMENGNVEERMHVRKERAYGSGERSFRALERGYGREERGFDREQRRYDREERKYGTQESRYSRGDKGYGNEERGYRRKDRGYGRDERGYEREERRYGVQERGYGREDTGAVRYSDDDFQLKRSQNTRVFHAPRQSPVRVNVAEIMKDE